MADWKMADRNWDWANGSSRGDLAEALGLLRSLEWVPARDMYDDIVGYQCPVCGEPCDRENEEFGWGSPPGSGHAPDCPLGAFLARHGGDDE